MGNFYEIDLGNNKICLVDEADFPLVQKYSWRWSPHSRIKDRGYVVATGRKPDGRYGTFSMHRLLMDPPKDKHVDHINGDRLDNRRANLRLASRSQNMFNMRTSPTRGSSKYKGVYWCKQKKKWHAVISTGRKAKHLGFFEDEALAALAYDRAVIELAGNFAHTNFPPSIVALVAQAS